MEVLNNKELRNVVSGVDGYNDYGFDTFSENLTDYCDEITVKDMDNIIAYLEDDVKIVSDAELKELEADQIDDLCDYINSLFD